MSATTASRPYHHGRLRDALVTAGVELARAEGPDVHGLSTLLNDGPLRDLPAAEHEHAVDVVLDVVARGL